MKIRWRISGAVTAAALMVMSLTACGGDEGGTSSVTASSRPQTTVSLPTVTVSELPSEPQEEKIVLLPAGSEFSCLTLTTGEFGTYIEENPEWSDPGYDVSQWTKAAAPLGDRVNGSSPIGWGGVDQEPHGLLAVTTFEIEDLAALEGKEFYMNIFYDNTIHMYINGTLVFSDDTADTGEDDWIDQYEDTDFTVDIVPLLTEGTNTVAVSLLDGWGGRELDFSILEK